MNFLPQINTYITQYFFAFIMGLSGVGVLSYFDTRYLSFTQYSEDRLNDRIEKISQRLIEVRLQISQNQQFDRYENSPAYGFIISNLKQVEASLNEQLKILLIEKKEGDNNG